MFHLPQYRSHAAQAITDMVIANESRVAKSRVVTTFNKARQVLFNLAIRCPRKAASLHSPKHALLLCLSLCSGVAHSHAASTFIMAQGSHSCCEAPLLPLLVQSTCKAWPFSCASEKAHPQHCGGDCLQVLGYRVPELCACCALQHS